MTPHQHMVLFALGSAMLLPVADALVKWLVRDYSIVLLVWARMAMVAAMLGVTGAAQVGVRRLLRPVGLKVQVARGFFAILGTSMFYLGVRYLPLAECTAVIFIAPVLANLMSHWLLKESSDARSWALAIASFVGVLLIARPGSALFQWPVLLPMVGSIGLAGFLTLTRAAATHDPPAVTAFFGPFVALVVTSLALPIVWEWPRSSTDALLFLAVGVVAALGQRLQVAAYRWGTTYQVAPFSYLSIVFSALLGWAVWGNVPDFLATVGMIVIIVAGLMMAMNHREV